MYDLVGAGVTVVVVWNFLLFTRTLTVTRKRLRKQVEKLARDLEIEREERVE